MNTLVAIVVAALSFLSLAFSTPVTAGPYIFTTIDDPAADTVNGERTRAFGINNAGQIVGIFTTLGGYRGFLYDDGIFTTIELPPGAASQNFPYGINNAGQIVGYFDSATGDHGFLATPMHRRSEGKSDKTNEHQTDDDFKSRCQRLQRCDCSTRMP